ncbi:MAG: hypothetical protein K0M63_01625 [Weeksellaceae bacterium]|jgi:outer membrane lipoprotein SlyB|nr:hypothetical protein [Weeksellaceae bacterium]
MKKSLFVAAFAALALVACKKTETVDNASETTDTVQVVTEDTVQVVTEDTVDVVTETVTTVDTLNTK